MTPEELQEERNRQYAQDYKEYMELVNSADSPREQRKEFAPQDWDGFMKKMLFEFLGVPTPPQTFRESLADEFKKNGWMW